MIFNIEDVRALRFSIELAKRWTTSINDHAIRSNAEALASLGLSESMVDVLLNDVNAGVRRITAHMNRLVVKLDEIEEVIIQNEGVADLLDIDDMDLS